MLGDLLAVEAGTPVRGHIIVQQVAFEPVSTLSPVLRQHKKLVIAAKASNPMSKARKDATFCLPLLDMKPVARSSLMLASTSGKPVLPSAQSSKSCWSDFQF